MKSWKKRLKDELDGIVPELREDVRNAPIVTGEQINRNGGNTAAVSRKNAIISYCFVAAAFIAVLTACIVLLSAPKPQSARGMLFTLEINPAVGLVSDGDGTVTDVMALNADADVILSADGARSNVVGKSVADAATYYADLAARLGFIDLNAAGSAVRISGYGDGSNELLGGAKSALEEYFVSRGAFAVVVAESVDREAFAARSGIPSGSDDEMAKYIFDNDMLFSTRIADGRSLDELQTMYGNNKNLQNLITDELSRNIDKLTKNFDDIQNLKSLYFRILNHDDNPASPLLKGYWEVKKYYADKLEGEFAELVAEMDEALIDYKVDYGVEITSFYQLQSVANSYFAVSAEQIAELIENFTYALFDSVSTELAEILTAAGVITESNVELTKLPQTVEEYYDKTKELSKTEYSFRLAEHENAYNAAREPIARAEYDGFIEDILSRYGSLDNYWQTIKSK